MRLRLKRVLGAIFVASCLTVLSYASVTGSPESLPVKSLHIEVVGEPESSAAAVAQTLKTKEQQPFSQKEFDNDLKQVAKEFDRAEPSVSVVDGEVVIDLKVWKKPMVRKILWKGNQAFDEKKLTSELGVSPASVYDRQAFNKAVQKLRQFYVRKGFFESEIEYRIIPVQDSKDIDVELTVNEGRAGLIEEIRFTNLTSDETEEVLDRLMTKEYCFWLSWLTNQGVYYKDVFRQDELSVLSYLQNKGYLDAKVATVIIPSEKRKDRVIIEVQVDRGELYHLGNVTVQGNTIFPTEKLLKQCGLSSSQVYSPEGVRLASRAIYELYGSKGYVDAAVLPETKVREHERIYDVVFKIDEGKCFRVGMIHIVGNTQTDTSLILHETLLTPGSIFDTTLLAKTEERLRNIGYFKTVNVYAVKSSKVAADGVAFRDVHIEVDENSNTARIMMFGGWNSTEGLLGGFGISETNFKLMGLSRLFSEGVRAVRGAGEYVSLSATIGTKQMTYNLSWSKPYFLDTPWLVSVDLQKQKNSYESESYTIHSYTATVSGKYPLNAFVKFGTHYRIRHSDIRLRDVSHSHRNRELIRESKNGGMISAVGASLIYDSTNHPMAPTNGLRSTVSAEYAGLGGDHHFLTLGYLNSAYFAPTQKGVMRLRGDVQAIQTVFGTKPRQLPMDERLYLGGDQTMRGFKQNYVGPKFHDTDRTPRGGMTSLLLSAEYEYPLWKRLKGFAFCDMGNVWWQQFTAGPLLYTAGFGIRFFITEQTPLTVGLGYPLNPKNHNDVRHFFFSVGLSF